MVRKRKNNKDIKEKFDELQIKYVEELVAKRVKRKSNNKMQIKSKR